jgi:hypothetical protein
LEAAQVGGWLFTPIFPSASFFSKSKVLPNLWQNMSFSGSTNHNNDSAQA